jgi:hypothetical protein|tara:strand:- start:495 stop:1085 length:591 start_codon:yes stop_codon:yes gene_type:complete
MSYRKEIKLRLNKSKIYNFKDLLSSRGAEILYPKRIVSSLYFDTNNKNCYRDSVEGVIPRKKIRIRSYPDEDIKIFLFEKKISSAEGRFKISKKISLTNANKIITLGHFDKMYGHLKPIMHIEYIREYYKYKNYRITIDSKINYRFYKKKFSKNDQMSIIELKYNIKLDDDAIINSFSNKTTRFSKYSNGLSLLNL